ncbi:MAG: hypothetical protein ACT4PL_13690 [Phycisphaerales bacterium]
MLTLPKIARLAASQRFDALLEEVCRNGRPRIGPLPSIAPTEVYATTPAALPLAALGLGLRRAVELSWLVETPTVDVAEALAQRICQLAALCCRTSKAMHLPEALRQGLDFGVSALDELLHHCAQTHSEIDPASFSRITAAHHIGRMMLEAQGTFMTPERAVQLSARRGPDSAAA